MACHAGARSRPGVRGCGRDRLRRRGRGRRHLGTAWDIAQGPGAWERPI